MSQWSSNSALNLFTDAVASRAERDTVPPQRAKIGRDFAEALHGELVTTGLLAECPLAEFLTDIEAGTSYLLGVRLEAGWLIDPGLPPGAMALH